MSHDTTIARSGTDRVICHCFQVTEQEIRRTQETLSASTVEEVIVATSAGSGCTACHYRIRRVLCGLPLSDGSFGMCNGCGCCAGRCICEEP